jgi:hypothetical protein
MTVSTPTTTDAMALGNAFFEDCKTVQEFMRDTVGPVVNRFAEKNHEDGTVYGIFLRAQAWLSTFTKLNHPSDFQAVVSGTRSMFEIAVDLALLHHDRANSPVAKMIAWEQSAKLKAADRTRRCYEGRTLPPEHVERVAFIDRDGGRIRAERARFWPGRNPNDHPQRWTGRPLDADAEAADGFGPYGCRDFYDGRFAELCWGTHGSALVSVRFTTPETFPGLAAMAFHDAAKFAVMTSELVLRYFRVFDAIAEARFRALDEERRKWRSLAFGKQKGWLRE